jgi:uncharacterized protein YbjT (DUF2867 family)
VDAAVAAGIRRIVYLSVHQADKALGIPHFVCKLPIEGVIRASGVEYTILRPNNFYQNDLAMRDVRDIAEAAAIALTEAGHSGKTYSVVGPRAWTGLETAEALTRHLGNAVIYGGDDLQAWAAQMRAFLPGWQVRDLEIMYEYFLRAGLLATQAEIDELTGVLGHAPRRYEAFVEEILAV